MKVMKLNFAQILDIEHPSEDLLNRPIPDETQVGPLMESILKEGLLSKPALVNREGVHVMMDGNHRLVAMKLAIRNRQEDFLARYPSGTISFDVYDSNEKGDTDILRTQLAGNLHSKQQVNSQFAKSIFRFCHLNGGSMNLEQLADTLHMTEIKLQQILKITRLPDEALALLDEGKLEVTNAVALTRLPKEELTPELLGQAATQTTNEFMETVNAVREELREARKKNPVERKKEFVPMAKMLAKREIETLFEAAESAVELNPEDVVCVARFELMKEIFQLDAAAVQRQKEAYDLKIKKAEEERAARKAAREAKKANEEKDVAAQVAAAQEQTTAEAQQ